VASFRAVCIVHAGLENRYTRELIRPLTDSRTWIVSPSVILTIVPLKSANDVADSG